MLVQNRGPVSVLPMSEDFGSATLKNINCVLVYGGTRNLDGMGAKNRNNVKKKTYPR